MAEPEPPGDENTRLALALLENDETALAEILRRYGPGIQKLLHAKYTLRLGVLRYEDIEDVMSIALQRLWDARKAYDDGIRPLRAWFYCIAVNVAKDVLKLGWHKARSLERLPGQDWLEESPQCAASEPVVVTGPGVRKESKKMEDLKSQFEKLPEVQRKILLADAESRDDVASSEVLAEELDIAAANVRVYRKRGMDKLRTDLRKLGHDIP